MKEQFIVNISFHELEIVLEIPSAIVGDGWKFVPFTEPLEVSNTTIISYTDLIRLYVHVYCIDT